MRKQILQGDAKPTGLSVILYHGVLRGLQILAVKPINQLYSAKKQEASKLIVSPDTDLVRLLANMILHKQSEVIHVS